VRILLIGGGKVGSYLARQFHAAGHTVLVTEADPAVARSLAESLDVLVLEGDGTSIDVLKAAEVGRSDWVVAVTGKDEENLVACQLAATLGAARALARLNDPRNRATFDALGIPVVAVTDLIGEVIEREVDLGRLERIAILGLGHISLIEIEIPRGVPDRAVVELSLPPQTLLVGVARAERVIVPGAETVLRSGDRVVAVTGVDQEPDVRAALCEIDSGTDHG
jgi:trk system potassium uptake protein TrkA